MAGPPVDPLERMKLLRDGLIDRSPVVCAECGRPIAPGDRALCNDGYERIYGEYVLSELHDLYEDNWPLAHSECARDEPQ
jgi:hypothetical protein